MATDVAGRGLHVRGLPYVVNYDFPGNLESYIHRVGRTGRLASTGHAYSFFTRNMAGLARPLVRLLAAHGQALDPNLVQLAEAVDKVRQVMGEEGVRRFEEQARDAEEAEKAKVEAELGASELAAAGEPARKQEEPSAKGMEGLANAERLEELLREGGADGGSGPTGRGKQQRSGGGVFRRRDLTAPACCVQVFRAPG